MELGDILKRVEERLTALDLSADRASDLAGKPDAIRNLRRAVKTGDRKGVNATTLGALASVLQTSTAWLLGDGAPTRPASKRPRPTPHVQGSMYLLRGTVEKLGSNSIPVDLDELVRGLFASHLGLSGDLDDSQVATLSLLRRLLGASSDALPRAEAALSRIAAESRGRSDRQGRAE